MNKELIILVISWIVVVVCLVKFVPKEKVGVAHITFLFAQAFAWVFEYLQVRFHLVEFPFREFEYASKMSFTLHYLISPANAVFFMILYPKHKDRKQLAVYYGLFGLILPAYAFWIERYSSLMEYKKWNWLAAYIVNVAALYIIKKFVFWFKKGLKG
jgi:hypothetical protein